MLYNWAIINPSLVSCIAGIYPAVNLRNWPPMGDQSFQVAAHEYVPSSPDTFSKRLSEFNPIEHLQPLVASHIPIFNIHGREDEKVAYAQNSLKLTDDYKALGGQACLMTLEGKEHGHVRHDPKFFESRDLLKFLVTHAEGK
jgi:hypothetical protein